MTQEEYLSRLGFLKKAYEVDKKNLAIEFAMSNNPYKVGDVIEDRVGKLKIGKIKVDDFLLHKPSCIYYGVELKKDGTPCKRQTGRCVYQSNIKQK